MARLIQFPRKLTWSEIRDIYQGQWVELHDVDWNAHISIPRRARVRHASFDRDTLFENIRNEKPVLESVILHVSTVDTVIAFESAGAAA